ncbi:RNA-binding protein, HP1423 type [Moorella glycerini]|uniref:RQC P-site tRNA stabilizing factor n=1 Tax=Neomoorella stamsii TaxID=1266720 RepID=A0A9X7J0P3_9FIRM|nr:MULTISPECIES: RNA-binding S4 domain-containing protein [Moorella]PRR68738.1 Heat shock protein 15 [Moorella stamsii]CEP68384.1 RNA-binding protein, HP1423 type [Moorella glycerini]
MRLDKFLKVSRLIKRRTLAKEVCDGGGVEVNRRPAKAGTDVKPGDILTLKLGNRWQTVEILATPESIAADRAKETYRVLAEGKTGPGEP